ncbi:MAG TPA: mechanosensitive ion channel [Candidatus Polarisedimenticolia bacterium]|nr:mechanosensitive ion channel [Candidatus Polarisedimenticolia bacterium]
MNGVLDQIRDMLTGYMPTLLGGLAILVLGWLFALIVAALVRAGLRRTTLDERLARWALGEDAARRIDIERWVGKGVYYVLLIFVLTAFLQHLNLTITAEPLNRLLTELSQFAPRLLGGAALLLIAWLVATILRQIVVRVLRAARFDERMGGQIGYDEVQPPLGETLATAVYWLVFLLFLPAILGALALEGLLEPVKGMTDQILGFLPNLFAAALILAIGWFVARIVQRIVANLLAVAGVDRLGERLKVGMAGERNLSGFIGLLVYVLILIPVVITSLNALQLQVITRPATEMLGQVMTAIPNIFAAVLLLGLAYLVGRLLAGLVTRVLAGAGFDTILVRLGLSKAGTRPERSPASIAGYVTLVIVMLFAAIEACRLLGFAVLADLVARFTVFAGQVVLGVIIFGIGLYLANLAAQIVQSSSAPQAGTLALVARISILVLAGAVALNQMGLADRIISLAFGIILGAVAVAVALAFGLGGRELAGKKLQDWAGRIGRRG